MGLYYDLETFSCPKTGEELCGDTIRVARSPERIIAILSDGLGSGVQASVSSTLTAELLSRLLIADIPLKEVLPTIAATLPVQQPQNAAYATFLIIDIDRYRKIATISNYGNPSVLFFKLGRLSTSNIKVEIIDNKEIQQQQLVLEDGDWIVAMSDGVPGANADVYFSDGWALTSISKHIEQSLTTKHITAKEICRSLADQTLKSYGMNPKDDASLIVVQVRNGREATVFTGPPSNMAMDDACVERFLKTPGRKIVCGGTTGNIVALYLGSKIRQIPDSEQDDVPGLSRIDTIDLTTEGILTLSRTSEYLERSKGNQNALPTTRNAAVLLSEELLLADTITFMVGLADNSAYTKLKMPSSVLLRRSIIRQLVGLLTSFGKEVNVEYY